MEMFRDISILTILEYINPYLNIIIALIIMVIIYYIAKKLLYRLRIKGIITRNTEGTLKVIILITLASIILPTLFSTVLQRYEILWLSIAIFTFMGVTIMVSLHSYLENSLMYIIVVASGILKDGDDIQIEIDGKSYIGRVTLTEGSHMHLRTNHGASVLIPYKKVFNAIIVKRQYTVLRFMIKIYGYNLDIESLIEKIVNIIKKAKTIIREEISVKLHEAADDNVSLDIEVGIMNPSNINECYEEIVKSLSMELPYKIDIKILE
jgi:hypothetical protein